MAYRVTRNEADNQNKEVLLSALRELNFEDEGLAAIAEADIEKACAFCIGDKHLRIDFLIKISGVRYEEANAQKIIAEIDGLPLPVLPLNHLVLSKFNKGRLKDAADIDELQRIEKARQKK